MTEKRQKFTSGKWRQYGLLIYAGGEAGGTICELSEPRAYDFVAHTPAQRGSKDQQEVYANAHLIAAAPEMYAALQAFMGAIGVDKQDLQAEKNAIQHAYELGRAALLAAEGGRP